MTLFNETVAAHLEGRTLEVSFLVHMDFRDSPRRWWQGFGLLEAGGHQWQGTGELIAIDGLDSPIGTVAPQTTFTLSGVDPTIVTMARNASDQVKGRRVRVYLQFFHVSPTDAGAQVHSTLDDPVAIWSGTMDQMQYAAEGPSQRSVTVTAESLWASRNRPPFGLYTDADQKARFPGDRGFEQVASLASKQIRWPSF